MNDTALTQTTLAAELAGQRVLITGGTKGIGAAIAMHAELAGADVLVAARRMPSSPVAGRFIHADVSTPEGVTTLAEEAAATLGGIDILVNNVGNPTHPPANVLETSDESWLGNLEMNLMTAVRLDRAVLPGMLERRHGVIIHMSSVVSRYPAADLLAYSTAKAALNSYSKGLSTELAPHGIRVNAVLPGLIETDGMTQYLSALASETGRDIEAARTNFMEGFSVPMGRMGHPIDVARLVVFLASPLAVYATGGLYTVDGGMSPGS
jgi:NAD(P)-dependent dehydrogenase (short-subunit alcohol dehydrogenase family)